jgi:hypothetical protein
VCHCLHRAEHTPAIRAICTHCSDDQPPCERFTGNLLGFGIPGPLPGNTWPITVTASLQQGKALLAALQANKITSVTVKNAYPTADVTVPIKFGIPGSAPGFAAAMGTGALGALWSAHTGCSAQQILSAVRATARAKVDPSLSADELKARYGNGLLQVIKGTYPELHVACRA